MNPDFAVVVPKPNFPKVPAAYMLPAGESEWRQVVNAWIGLKRTDRTTDRLYDYWILGREAEAHEPRWSVIRDVLHWVD